MLTKYPQPRNKIPVKYKKDRDKTERGVALIKYPLHLICERKNKFTS